MSPIAAAALGLALGRRRRRRGGCGLAAGVAGAAGLGDVEAVLEHAASTMASDAIGMIRKRFMEVPFLRGRGQVPGEGPVGLVNAQII